MKGIVEKDPNAIVLVDVPLLIELNLQYMFHKTLLVYAPQEIQIERLMERDGIGEEEALSRIKAQVPIEEKVGYADYVIHNDQPLEETRRQAQDLWQTLRKAQEDRK